MKHRRKVLLLEESLDMVCTRKSKQKSQVFMLHMVSQSLTSDGDKKDNKPLPLRIRYQ